LLSDAALLVIQQLLLKLVNFLLLVLVNVVELALFKVKLAQFIQQRESTHGLGATEAIWNLG